MARDRLGVLLTPLILGLFLLPALIPLLQVDALPCTHDDVFHTFRIVAMRDMLRHGWLFSRWVPNLALGYGYPFFNYREPLPYLVGEALYVVGIPLPLVMGGIYAVSLVGAAWGAYALARELFGPRAALVSGVAYGLGPYLLLDSLRRGNMPESVALALLPWLFLVARRLIRGGSRRRVLGSFLTLLLLLTGLFLSHNISSLLLAPFLGAFVIVLAWHYRDRRSWPYAFAAVLGAALITAWFWLPALSEQGWVQLHLSRTTRNNDFRYNFATWREILLTLPAPHDPAFLNPPMRVPLGVGQALLAALGVPLGLGLARRREGLRRERRLLIVLFAVVTGVYLWMATPGSRWLWEAVPLLAFVQFPWRLVGRALLPATLLAGAAVEGWVDLLQAWRDGRGGSGRRGTAASLRWGGVMSVVVVVAALVLLAWPETYPPKGMCAAEARPDLEDLYARELDGWIGMDPESSYFPIWVEEHPTDTSLAEAFVAGRVPARFDATVLPDGAGVVEASYRPLRASVTVKSPERFRARWLGLYFPGWQVRIDGAQVPVAPEDDTGLMTFSVPAGTHEIDVRFGGRTPARTIGTVLAGLGVAVAAGAVLLLRGRWGDTEAPAGAPAGAASGRLQGWLAALAVAFALVRFVVVPSLSTPVQRSRLADGDPPEVAVSSVHPFGDGLTLLGMTLPSGPVASDEELLVALLWQARSVPGRDYVTSVLLRGEDGQIWSPAGTARPREYETAPPTSAWSPGAYVYDPHVVTTMPGAPPGDYEIVVAAFDADTQVPLSVLDEHGSPIGPDLVLGRVQIARPQEPFSLAELARSPLPAPARCGSLGLWEMTADRAIGAPGDVVAVRWVWEALAPPANPEIATVQLLDPAGAEVRRWTLPPATSWWPTDAWRAGELWVGRHVLRLPGDLESGVHRLVVGLGGCEAPLAHVDLTVEAPPRAWSLPEGFAETSVVYDDRVELIGYTMTPTAPEAGDALAVGLAWQARVPVEEAYRVFLHLVDEAGRRVDQSDGEPVDWTRPTTGWAVGEVVVERRTVSLPPDAAGVFRLHVGLYLPGEPPLSTSEGADGAVLDTFRVE